MNKNPHSDPCVRGGEPLCPYVDFAAILPLDKNTRIDIIYINIFKYVDEDEYALMRRPREQETVKSCTYGSAEWTSELQGERSLIQ